MAGLNIQGNFNQLTKTTLDSMQVGSLIRSRYSAYLQKQAITKGEVQHQLDAQIHAKESGLNVSDAEISKWKDALNKTEIPQAKSLKDALHQDEAINQHELTLDNLHNSIPNNVADMSEEEKKVAEKNAINSVYLGADKDVANNTRNAMYNSYESDSFSNSYQPVSDVQSWNQQRGILKQRQVQAKVDDAIRTKIESKANAKFNKPSIKGGRKGI